MPTRSLDATVAAGADSSLTQPTFGPFRIVCNQNKDLQDFSTVKRVAPADVDTQVALGPIATAYFIAVFADYPIKVRLNGAAATQLTMNTNNVPSVNAGSPLPPQCALIFTGQVTSLYVAPIASAAQTANVTVYASGDPSSAYT